MWIKAASSEEPRLRQSRLSGGCVGRVGRGRTLSIWDIHTKDKEALVGPN